jgi:hypothetical protein
MTKPRRCDVVDCDAYAVALGLCSRHYGQNRKGWKLQRRGETIPRGTERAPWTYEGREAELIARYEEGSTANV